MPQKFSLVPSNYEFLKKLRTKKKVSLKACNLLKPDVVLRNYQAIGCLHFLLLSRMILGDSAGLGKTLTLITAYLYYLAKNPKLKLLVVAPKSAVDQWAEEFDKFTTGISVHVLRNEYGKVLGEEIYGDPKELKKKGYEVEKLTSFEARQAQYRTVDAKVLVCSYFPVQKDYVFLVENRMPEYMVAFDEAQEFKGEKTQAYFGAKKIAEHAKNAYGLSATIIKNKLEEAYNIFNVIVPGLYGSKAKFQKEFCVLKKQDRPKRGGGKIKRKVVVGYKNLNKFKELLDPYFLIRRTREVADELPRIISKKSILEMSPAQNSLYKMALEGDIYRKRAKIQYFEYEEYIKNNPNPTEKELKKLTSLEYRYEESLTEQGLEKNKLAALIYCQMISNGPAWLNSEEVGESSKEVEFKRIFEQELCTEKVIIFTRFKSGIPRLQKILDEAGIKHVSITGDVKQEDRKKNRLAFTDPKQNITAIFITQAGSAALNLQAANVLLFYDTPWSYGDLYQTIGRAQRIGSIYEHLHVIHFVNKGTIDERVLKVLSGKKELINEVMGDIAEGAVSFGDEIMFKEDEGSVDALFNAVFRS